MSILYEYAVCSTHFDIFEVFNYMHESERLLEMSYELVE